MPTLRIYYNSFFDTKLENIENKTEKHLINIEDKNSEAQPGFLKKERVFSKILGDYYIANYIDIGYKAIPSMKSELAYFNFIEESGESEEKNFPVIIKIIINKEEGILCFYSRQIIKNKEANNLIKKLQKSYGFNFKFSLINNHYVFRRNELTDFLNILDIDDFTAISVFDEDNELIIKNSNSLTKTKKLILFLNELNNGNWSYVRLVNSELDFEIRLSNNKTQNYLTLENKYGNDMHLVKVVDYLTKKIKEAEKGSVLNRKKQTCLDYYQKLEV
jgi:hypothetical protein